MTSMKKRYWYIKRCVSLLSAPSPNFTKTNYTFAQGYTLNAPSEVLVRLNTTPQKTIDQVLVGGRGYYVETKELFL